jgi:membrane protein
LLVLGRRYLKGDRPLRLSELAIELNLPLSLVEEQVEHLIECGFVSRLNEPEGINLMKPAELISVKEVLDTIRNGSPPGAFVPADTGDSISNVLRRRDEAIEQALAGQTLRSLVIEQNHQAME